MSTVVDPVGSDLSKILSTLKLSGLKQTLPERLLLARQTNMGHAAFLELLLADEVARRGTRSAALRAGKAGLDPAMRLDTFDDLPDLAYDRTLWSDLTSLRFTENATGVLILGPPVINGLTLDGGCSGWSGRCCDRCDMSGWVG